MYNIFSKLLRRSSNSREKKALLKDEIIENDVIGHDEKHILLKILDLTISTVEDIIIPRSDIIGIADNLDFFSVIKYFAKTDARQLPVYEDSLDKIIGYVDLTDVLGYIENPMDFKVNRVMKDVQFIVPNMRVVDAITQMKANCLRFLVIVDEFGGVDGLVSLEKIMYEVFGDFCSSGSNSSKFIVKTTNPNEFMVDAKAPIETCEEVLGVKLLESNDEESPDIETLGGLIISISGKVPAVGDLLVHKSGIEFVIIEANLRKVQKILVRKNVGNIRQ